MDEVGVEEGVGQVPGEDVERVERLVRGGEDAEDDARREVDASYCLPE